MAENPEVQAPPAPSRLSGAQVPERLLVCLGPYPLSLRLVRAAHRIAAAQGSEWFALYVETPDHERLPATPRETVSQVLRLASHLGARVIRLSGFRVGHEILNFARENQITKIMLGKPQKGPWRRLLGGTLVDYLIRHSGPLDVLVVSGEEEEAGEKLSLAPVRSGIRAALQGYLLATLGVGACTGVAAFLFPYLTFTSLVMLYLLTVVVVSSVLSRGPAIFSVVAGLLVFAFFFVPDYWSFNIGNPDYAITLLVMLLVSLLISELTGRIRYQARVARRQERQTAALYELSQRLSGADGHDTLLRAAVDHISRIFGGQVSILLPGGDGRLQLAAGHPLPEDVREGMVARWVYRYGHIAGAGTGTLSAVRGIYVPLLAGPRPLGVLRLEPSQPEEPLAADSLPLLEALARQLGLSLERDQLGREAREAQLAMEAERMRNILLSSVSHDLKTPLTVIAGAASSLLEGRGQLEEATQIELAQTIYEEAERLDRLVANLLEMSRLQSGQVTLHKDWHILEEVLGTALHQMEMPLRGRPLKIDLPPDIPLLKIDALLIERVFINLLDNAVKYTPAGTPLEISGHLENQQVVVEVADRGPGLPEEAAARLFEKFYQAAPKSGRGVGLGLSICQSIIEIHGGRIWGGNRPGGGAFFRFSLPLAKEAPTLGQDLPEMDEAKEHEA